MSITKEISGYSMFSTNQDNLVVYMVFIIYAKLDLASICRFHRMEKHFERWIFSTIIFSILFSPKVCPCQSELILCNVVKKNLKNLCLGSTSVNFTKSTRYLITHGLKEQIPLTELLGTSSSRLLLPRNLLCL